MSENFNDMLVDQSTPKSDKPNFKLIINKYRNLINQKISTDDMKFLKKFHKDDYEKTMSEFVPQFKEEYPFLFKLLINGEDMSNLDLFLDNIESIDSGKKTINQARNELGQILHNKYVNI
jgi:hypothetical protein